MPFFLSFIGCKVCQILQTVQRLAMLANKDTQPIPMEFQFNFTILAIDELFDDEIHPHGLEKGFQKGLGILGSGFPFFLRIRRNRRFGDFRFLFRSRSFRRFRDRF